MPILKRHRDRVCCFNDDIQGTAAVTLGCLLAACKRKGETLKDQKIAFVGAGSAGCGIAELVVRAMVIQGLTDLEARARIFMIDRQGLVTSDMVNLMDFQQVLTQDKAMLSDWQLSDDNETLELMDVVSNAHPSVLIGVSGKPGLFTEAIIREMHAHCPRPVVLPLSNPSKHVEAHPDQVIEWTDGQAIVATGSPFFAVDYAGKKFEISQCNNSYIFPGIGLGIVASKSSRVSDAMLMKASITLAELAPVSNANTDGILPPLTDLPFISRAIAFAVAKVAMSEGHAREITDEELNSAIERNFWTPEYREYRRIATRAR
jgi:malate dehydrogenase (oxaloacetate-decarboxylating)